MPHAPLGACGIYVYVIVFAKKSQISYIWYSFYTPRFSLAISAHSRKNFLSLWCQATYNRLTDIFFSESVSLILTTKSGKFQYT